MRAAERDLDDIAPVDITVDRCQADRAEKIADQKTELIAGVQDEAYEGLPANDFSNRTVNITSDLDMGGTDPSNIDHASNAGANIYEGIYPNWTPIGGEYLMDPSSGATMIKASFGAP